MKLGIIVKLSSSQGFIVNEIKTGLLDFDI